MGFKNLYLINPAEYKIDKTYQLAWGAEEIINKAKCFNTLEDAIKGMHLVIGTTQRKRKRRENRPIYSPKGLTEEIAKLSNKQKIGILFGREATGLTKEELALCNLLSTIPHKTDYPSLNLSQAVMVYCYEIFKNLNNLDKSLNLDIAAPEELEHMYKHIQQALEKIDFDFRNSSEEFMLHFKRIFGRTFLEKRDVKIVHLLCSLLS